MKRNHLKSDLVTLLVIVPLGVTATPGCNAGSEPASPPPTATANSAPAAPANGSSPAATIAGQGDVVRMALGRETFTLEVADSDVEHQRGLMYRESMPADHGMIFVFDEESPRSFWMRNTLIPLDIVYVNTSGTVVSVKQMKPRDETPVPSGGPARYAIELNQGAAGRAGVKAGDVLTLPNEITSRPARATGR